jgi:hypothetical protein
VSLKGITGDDDDDATVPFEVIKAGKYFSFPTTPTMAPGPTKSLKGVGMRN